MMPAVRRIVGAPLEWWRRSLPFRVVASSLAVSAFLLGLVAWLLTSQVLQGMLDAKTRASVTEAAAVLGVLQGELRSANPKTTNLDNQVIALAREASDRGNIADRYSVLVTGPVSEVASVGVDPASVPASLRTAVVEGGSGQMFTSFTRIEYTDFRAARQGLVVGGSLAPSAGDDPRRVPVYFMFPLTQEEGVLVVVRQAALVTALVFLPVTAVLMFGISLQILRPVRAARRAAESLAAGNLDRRMDVLGPEDSAGLARAVNHMADELSRRLTELEAMTHLQHQFVSDVSHELRTPLTTVRMAADVIYDAREEFSPVTARSAELLSREVDRFETLLNDLLDLSRIDAGAAVLVIEETDLVELVRAEVASQRPLAEAYGSELVLDAPDSCPARVDQLRVRRIVTNLLTNAIEHGEGRPIDVHVRVKAGVVAIAVRDYGVGLSEAEQAHVFTRFWRGDPSRLRTVGGTGLGLAIALENAELHGGSLDVWGRRGGGAQFLLLLPVAPGAPLTSSAWPLVPPDAARSGGTA